MPKRRPRVFSRAFKLSAVRRMLAGEDVSALSRELQVPRKDLYYGRAHFRAGGPEALRSRGRPRKVEVISEKPKDPPGELEAARDRIAELERRSASNRLNSIFFD